MSTLLEPPRSLANELPTELSRRIGERLGEQTVLDWAEVDLDAANRFATSYVVLTPRQLFVVADAVTATDVDSMTKADVVEGVGMDRLVIGVGGGGAVELRYSRRCRRDVVRLNRKLGRLLPTADGKADTRPDWLDRVERQAALEQPCSRCGQLMPASVNRVCARCAQGRSVLWRLMDVAKPYRRALLGALALTLVHAGFATAPGVVMKHLIDDSLANRVLDQAHRLHNLYFWAGLFGVIILLSELLGGARMAILSIVGTRVTRDLRHDVYAHLHTLSMRFYAKRRSGSLITRVTNDTDRLWDFIVFGSVNVIRDVLMITLSVIIMCSMNWRLACISLTPLPLIAVAAWWRGRKMHAMFTHMWTYWGPHQRGRRRRDGRRAGRQSFRRRAARSRTLRQPQQRVHPEGAGSEQDVVAAPAGRECIDAAEHAADLGGRRVSGDRTLERAE